MWVDVRIAAFFSCSQRAAGQFWTFTVWNFVKHSELTVLKVGAPVSHLLA